jgi:hypothetical protein
MFYNIFIYVGFYSQNKTIINIGITNHFIEK